MSVENRIAELKRRHVELSEEVEVREKSPGADATEIASLKKQKLRLKDEISRLS